MKHFINDDAQRPDIYFLVVGGVSGDFWGHVEEIS